MKKTGDIDGTQSNLNIVHRHLGLSDHPAPRR
jgi:hypothetical protein